MEHKDIIVKGMSLAFRFLESNPPDDILVISPIKEIKLFGRM